MLEKKEKVLLKKAAAEVEKAKEFTRAKNKRGMIAKCMHFFTENIIFMVLCLWLFCVFKCLKFYLFDIYAHTRATWCVIFLWILLYFLCFFSCNASLLVFWCSMHSFSTGKFLKEKIHEFFFPFLSKTIKPHNWNILIMTPEEKSTLFFRSQQTCKHWHTQCSLTCLFHCFVLNIQ